MHRGVLDLVSPQHGHFLLESGYHANMWLDLETLFLHPGRVEPLAVELARRIAQYEVDVVCGPLVEGAFVGLMVAKELGVPFTYSERFARDETAALYPYGYRVPDSQHRHLRDKRVAVVNDVISAGSAVGGTWASLQAIGAKPVVIGALLVLSDWTARFAAENRAAAEALETMSYELWPAEECPLCLSGEALA